VRVVVVAGGRALTPTAVRGVVRHVLAGERVGAADLTVTQVSSQRMRALNRRAFGRDRATDVIAFGMRHQGRLIGDVYICPAVAARSAVRFGVALREELVRLVVHGTLHALGHDHPGTEARVHSAMWRRQERYVRAVLGRGSV
jgi:probable rRNA maturation factor